MSIAKVNLHNHLVRLIPLNGDMAEFYHSLYTHSQVIEHYDEAAVRPGETALQFTQRIMRACNQIWTIRLAEAENEIIGDIALHDYNSLDKTIEFGGALLPIYWGKGIMQSAFSLIIAFVNENYNVKRIMAHTTASNEKAIRLVSKLGFTEMSKNTFVLDL